MIKYYVVRVGKTPGIYNSRDDCNKNVLGYPNAKYKSFKTKSEAEIARNESYQDYYGNKESKNRKTGNFPFKKNSIAVDAACSGNPGEVEYQGIDLITSEIIFHQKYDWGTNNIGEFLALVEGLKYLQKNNSDQYIYSDSKHAISRIGEKICKTKLERTKKTEKIFEVIKEAEERLNRNQISTKILKRNTRERGEIPADFNRK